MTELDIDFMTDLFQQVGDHLLEEFRQSPPPADMTEVFGYFGRANGWATDLIRSQLAEKYPAVRWSESEFDLDQQNNPEFEGAYWICDPIDGALHLFQGIPLWATSLCLIENGQPAFSLVYEPYQKQRFYAYAGKGAFRNGELIHVASKTDLGLTILATSHPSRVTEEPELTRQTTNTYAQVLPQIVALKMLGSVSLQLAYVASGRLDGYWELGHDMYDWLAGALLVQEAGGQVTDASGQKFGWGSRGLIATNPALHPQLQKVVQAGLNKNT